MTMFSAESASTAAGQLGDLLSQPLAQYGIVGYVLYWGWTNRETLLNLLADLIGGFQKRIDTARKG